MTALALVLGGCPPAVPVETFAVSAGVNRSTAVGTVVLLGATSTGGKAEVTFRWTLAERPVGSVAMLLASDGLQTELNPDLPGAYLVRLDGVDGQQKVASATMTITAQSTNSTGPETTILTAPQDPTSATTASFFFVASEPAATFVCQLDADPSGPCTSPRVLTGLSRVRHTFKVFAVDEAGNPDPSPAVHSWTIDETTLDTVLTNGPADLSASTSATFWFVGSSFGLSFRCQLDSGAESSCSSPQTYVDLADGSHSFRVRATDATGVFDLTAATRAWTVDTLPPQTTITAQPANPSNVTAPTISFSSSEGGGFFNCRIDLGVFSRCASPLSLAPLSDGQHTFQVISVDAAGNADPNPSSIVWSVDTVTPTTWLTSAPAALSTTPSPSFGFSASETSTFRCSLDGAPLTACSAPWMLFALSDGAHSFLVIATDTATNVDPAGATHNWTIDATPPDTTLASGAPSGSTSQTSGTFTFSSPDPAATFRCRPDLGPTVDCTSPQTVTGLSDGPHSFTITAVDLAGNVDPSPATTGWTVDTVPPNTEFSSTPPALVASATATLSFFSTETGSFLCTLDGATPAACASPQVYAGLADGPHTFGVHAIDLAGNADPSPSTWAWTVDTTPPLVPTGLTAVPGNRQITVNFAPVAGATNYSVRYDTDDGNPPFASSVTVIGGTTLTSLLNCTTYYITVSSLDSLGNESALAPVVLAAPTLPAPTAQVAGGGGLINVTWGAVPNATGYRVKYGPTAGGPYDGTAALNGPSPVAVTGTTVSLRGIPATSTQHLRVTALQGSCEGPGSPEARSSSYPWQWVSPTPTGNDLNAVDCTSPTNCVAVGSIGTALTTSTAGTAWAQQNAGTGGTMVELDMVDATTGYSIVGREVFKTTNGGAQWAPTATAPNFGATTWYGLSFVSATQGFVVGDTGVIASTSNGGASWTTLNSGTIARLNAVHMLDAITGYAVGQSGKIIKTTDGANWTAQTSPIASEFFSVHCQSPTLCLAAGTNGGPGGELVRTTDGTTWVATPSAPNNLRKVRFASASRAWAVGDSGRVRISNDSGATWTTQPSGETDSILGLVVIDSSTAIVVGNGGLIRKTVDGGATWVSLKSTLSAGTLSSIKFLDANTALIAGPGGLILRSTSGGASWAVVPSGAAVDLSALSFAGASTGYAVGVGGAVLKSVDSGASWSSQTSGTTSDLRAIHCISDTQCWAAGNGGQVRRTSNGGVTWLPKATSGNLSSIFFFDALRGWVGAENHCASAGCYTGVLYSVDSGDFWTSPTYFSNGMALHFKDAQTGWMAGGGGSNPCSSGLNDSGVIHRTTNGGVNWSSENNSGGGCFFALEYVTDNEMYAVGWGGKISKRTTSWTALLAPTRWTLRSVERQPNGTVWTVGERGTVLKSDTGGQ